MAVVTGNIIEERYEVLSELGGGGMGTVFLARDLQLDREVAIKVMQAPLNGEPVDDVRFQREAMVLARLHHPNIVAVYAAGIWAGQRYLVMELVQGKSLQQHLLENDTLNNQQSLEIAQQMAEALRCAHLNGVIHRDLKPSNVIVLDDQAGFHVKVVDFGLAALMPGCNGADQKLTAEGSAVGTVQYMSPEQSLGGVITPRSDLYSLGCVLFHCLLGRPPFACENAVETMRAHLYQPIPELKVPGLDDNLNAAWQAIIVELLSKEPEDRYASAEDLMEDLALLKKPDDPNFQKLVLRASHSMKVVTGVRHPRCWPGIAQKHLLILLLAILVGGGLCALLLPSVKFDARVLSPNPSPTNERQRITMAAFESHTDIAMDAFESRDKTVRKRGVKILHDLLPLGNFSTENDKLAVELALIAGRLAREGSLDDARQYMKRANEIADDLFLRENSRVFLGQVRSTIEVLTMSGDRKAARDFAERSMPKVSKMLALGPSDDALAPVPTVTSIATACIVDLRDPVLAQKYLELGLQLRDERDNRELLLMQATVIDHAGAQKLLGQFDVPLCTRRLDALAKYGPNWYLSIAYRFLGDLCQTHERIDYFKKALSAYADDPKRYTPTVRCELALSLANLLRSERRNSEALQYADMTLRLPGGDRNSFLEASLIKASLLPAQQKVALLTKVAERFAKIPPSSDKECLLRKQVLAALQAARKSELEPGSPR